MVLVQSHESYSRQVILLAVAFSRFPALGKKKAILSVSFPSSKWDSVGQATRRCLVEHHPTSLMTRQRFGPKAGPRPQEGRFGVDEASFGRTVQKYFTLTSAASVTGQHLQGSVRETCWIKRPVFNSGEPLRNPQRGPKEYHPAFSAPSLAIGNQRKTSNRHRIHC